MKRLIINTLLVLFAAFTLSAETKKMYMGIYQISTETFIGSEFVDYSVAEEDIKYAFEHDQVVAWYEDTTVTTHKDNCRIVVQLNNNLGVWYGMDREEYTHILLVNDILAYKKRTGAIDWEESK